MTTLQTHSAHNTSSADYVRQRAQTLNPRAADAPGFAGVLDAFTQKPDQHEPSEDAQAVDDADQSESQGTEETEQSPVDDEQPVDQNDSTTKADAEKIPQEQGSGDSKSIDSTADLEALLINAATIDLAGLASQQLQAGPANQSAGDSVSNLGGPAGAEAGSGLQSAGPKQPEGSNGGGGGKPSPYGPDFPFGPPSTSVTGDQGSSVHQGNHTGEMTNASQQGKPVAQSASVDQPIQTPPIIAQPTEVKFAADPGKLFAAQSIQAQAPDFTANARRLQSLRSSQEVAAGVGKTKEVSASETAGKSGAQDSGMDMGNKAPNLTKVLQSKPENDQAMQRQQVIAQVQRGLASILNTKGGTMKLRLSPDHLGEVNIKLTTKDGRVDVQFDAKNESTRTMLSEGLDGLRQAIEARGATVDELNVNGQQQSKFEQLFGHSDQTTQSGSQHQDTPRDSESNNPGQQHNQQLQPEIDDLGQAENQPRGIWTDLGLDAIA